MLRFGKESCPHCDQDEIYVSRPQGLWEALAAAPDCEMPQLRGPFLSTAVAANPIPSDQAKLRRGSPHDLKPHACCRRSAR